jgi:hypothetical protein
MKKIKKIYKPKKCIICREPYQFTAGGCYTKQDRIEKIQWKYAKSKKCFNCYILKKEKN